VKHRPLWICLALAACGAKAPAASTPPSAEASAAAAPAAEPAAPPPAAPEPDKAVPEKALPEKALPDKPLYERLGGEPAITAVVDEFVNRTTTDARIKYRFFNTDPVSLKRLLVEFVCVASGGPCKYTGRDMTSAHAGMDLVDDEFTALVENLIAAMDKFHVPDREKGEVLGALGPLKPQIVVPPDRLRPIPEARLATASALVSTLKDKEAASFLSAAITAGQRGQRSFAEQLFSRAEIIVGAQALASASEAFREGAPPRVNTRLRPMKDTAPQPAAGVGSSDADNPARPGRTAGRAMLHGALRLDGKPLTGMALVMMWPTSGPAARRTPKARVVEQRGKTFAPHLLAVPVGSTVAFPNFDTVYHNVFSLSQPQRFDLGLYKAGDMREVVFDKPGIVRLGCNIHTNMSGYVVVVDAPHYVVADADGKFSFKSLGPGKYKVRAWSEQSAEPRTTEIVLKPGANETAIDLTGGAPQGPSEDKFGAAR
jgi:hemoglobin